MKKRYIKPMSNMLNVQPTTILNGSETMQSGGGNGDGGPTKAEAHEYYFFDDMEEEW